MKAIYLFVIISLMAIAGKAQVLTGDSIPVRLQTLDAKRVNIINQLNWSVVCSLPFALFEVQRSADGARYTTIHQFQADALRCREPFEYADEHAAEKSFYRVRVGDPDGKFYTSKIVVIYGKATGFDVSNVPGIVTTQSLTLNISSSSADKVEIAITSLQGNITRKQRASIVKGSNTVPVYLPASATGLYLLTVTNGAGEVKTAKFIKQ